MSQGVIGRTFSSSSLSKRETFEMDRNNRMKSVKIELAPPDKDAEEPKPELKLLFIDLNGFPPSVQFLLCSSGVFFFYLIYAYFQVCLSHDNISLIGLLFLIIWVPFTSKNLILRKADLVPLSTSI